LSAESAEFVVKAHKDGLLGGAFTEDTDGIDCAIAVPLVLLK
jgi:hypothetical protein